MKTPKSKTVHGNKNPHERDVPGNKNPRTRVVRDLSKEQPKWRFSLLDIEGPWSPLNAKSKDVVLAVLSRLKDFETMTWQAIRASKSHYVTDIDKLSKAARDRLNKLNLDDMDGLYSLRFSGTQRLWGFLRDGVFDILWWDPIHEVYPSSKKHT
ncbi:MAG: hypothetical protein KAI47_16930 [Deltaproteobacteria bacterium]|nr:hypothetical protein [Deltaproteobacteria bacterium]